MLGISIAAPSSASYYRVDIEEQRDHSGQNPGGIAAYQPVLKVLQDPGPVFHHSTHAVYRAVDHPNVETLPQDVARAGYSGVHEDSVVHFVDVVLPAQHLVYG